MFAYIYFFYPICEIYMGCLKVTIPSFISLLLCHCTGRLSCMLNEPKSGLNVKNVANTFKPG